VRSRRPDGADALPFPGEHFDAACLVTVLGEIPYYALLARPA
jgi:hypothetical protein